MFTQSCFIRKNNENLRNKLEELGYTTTSICKSGNIATSSTVGKYSIISDWHWNSTNPHTTWNNGNRIDCGTNEELFLAIAALRDDKPDYQWFVWDDDEVAYNKFKQYIPNEPWQDWWWFEVHKASVEELIEYFK